MEASHSIPSASLLLPSLAVHVEIGAGQHSGGKTHEPPRPHWLTLERLLRYARCLHEHKSGSIVSWTQWKRGEAHASARYRCSGCGLLWSPRWRR